ncbi:MAG: hypothetical protein ACE5OY_00485 [Candidatus Bathyarchaeia archaeon]
MRTLREPRGITHLRKRKGERSKRSRRIVNRMPHGLSAQAKPALGVDTYKWNWVGYGYFSCRECGMSATETERQQERSR